MTMYVPIENGFFRDTPGFSRFDFPDRLVRVTGGSGGEAILIIGSEKTALHDTGMACFKDELISNIHEVLDPLGRTLDYVLMSHTHYDHIGALPYLEEAFPDMKVCGSPVAAKVFKSETAISTMERLGNEACELYGKSGMKVTARGMRLDIPLYDLDEIDLGDRKVIVYEGKGHTDCSLLYGVVGGEQSILLMNESVGSYAGRGKVYSAVLKDVDDTIAAARRMKKIPYDVLIAMHYGVVDPESAKTYFDDYIRVALAENQQITDMIRAGADDSEIIKDRDAVNWTEKRNINQPYNAYRTNLEILIKKLRAKVEQEG